MTVKPTVTLPTATLVHWLKWLNKADIEPNASGPIEGVASDIAMVLNDAGFDTSSDPETWPDSWPVLLDD